MLRPLAFAALGGILLPLVAVSTPAEAQEHRVYRFCHVIYESVARYSHQRCHYTSHAQCMATASGVGGQCSENPEWVMLNRQSPRAVKKRRSAR